MAVHNYVVYKSLKCARIIQHGVPAPAIILEVARRIDSFCCLSDGTLCTCDVQNVTKVLNCNASGAFLSFKMHPNSLQRSQTPPYRLRKEILSHFSPVGIFF